MTQGPDESEQHGLSFRDVRSCDCVYKVEPGKPLQPSTCYTTAVGTGREPATPMNRQSHVSICRKSFCRVASTVCSQSRQCSHKSLAGNFGGTSTARQARDTRRSIAWLSSPHLYMSDPVCSPNTRHVAPLSSLKPRNSASHFFAYILQERQKLDH